MLRELLHGTPAGFDTPAIYTGSGSYRGLFRRSGNFFSGGDPVKRTYSSVAQLVERLAVNQDVAGSKPAGGA